MVSKALAAVIVVIAVLVGFSVVAYAFNVQIWPFATTPPTTTSSQGQAPSGYSGATYVSGTSTYPLTVFSGSAITSNENIPVSSGNGVFVFTFSNQVYHASQVSATYQSCVRTFSGMSVTTACAASVPFALTYTASGTGETFTTPTTSPPCEGLTNFNGNQAVSNYWLVRFTVNSVGTSGSSTYTWEYLVYINGC